MSDEELTARVLELQAQPDGLVSAMALIEEQTRLREEDALILARWKMEAQLRDITPQAEVLENFAPPASNSNPPEVPEPQGEQSLFPPNDPTQPEVDIFARFAGASLAEEVAPVDSPAGGENLQSEAEQLDSSSPEFDEWSETKQQ
ncbi:MAG: hypothetical protein ACKOXT_03735, partial [Actinomycetota bacterium]